MIDPSRVPEPTAKPHHAPSQHELEKHIVHEKHPEEVDPLGRQHKAPVDPAEKRIMTILTVGVVAAIILIPVISAISESPMLNVFLGLSPLLITLILDMVATQQHFKPVVFWLILAVTHVVALGLLWLINIVLPVKMNVPSAVSVSLILGVLITAACWLSNPKEAMPKPKKEHVVQFRPEKLAEYVQSIEDKCKGMNFVIGRVYRNSNGGTPQMRERLKIPSEWYNEFHSIKAEDMGEQQEKAKVLINKIRDRLRVLASKEKDVFSQGEIGSIKHIMRARDGSDSVIDVLKANDRDPVEHYYVSAVEFCDRILHELEKQ